MYASTTTAKPQVKITLPGSSQCLTLLHDEPTGMFCAIEPVSDKSGGGFRDPDGVGVLVPSHFSILEGHQDLSDVKISEELLTSAFQTMYGAKPFHFLHDEHKKRKRVFSASGNHMSAPRCSIGPLCEAYIRHCVSANTVASDSIACELFPYCMTLNASIRSSRNPLKFLVPVVASKIQTTLYTVTLDAYVREGIIAQEAFDTSVNGKEAIMKLDKESNAVNRDYLSRRDSAGNHDYRLTLDTQRRIADLNCVKGHIGAGRMQDRQPTPLDFPDLFDVKDQLTKKRLSKVTNKTKMTVRPPKAEATRKSMRLIANSPLFK